MRTDNHILKTLTSDFSGKAAIIILALWILISISSFFTNIVHFSANEIDKLNANFMPPGSQNADGFVHYMGTDGIGRDIAAGLIHGSYYAFVICSLTLVISLIIGLLLGLPAGYFGNKGLKLNFIQIIALFFYISMVSYGLVYAMVSLWGMVISLSFFIFVMWLLGKTPLKKLPVSIDLWMIKLFEIKESIPALMIILFVVGYLGTMNMIVLSLLISLFYSITYARYIRNETLAIRDENYIASARSSGLPNWMIMKNHIMPNILPYIIPVIIFSLSGVILLESTLSFLGIGLSVESVTWGNILAQSRLKPSAWWMAIFPGLAIFLVVWSLNIIGERLTSSLKGE